MLDVKDGEFEMREADRSFLSHCLILAVEKFEESVKTLTGVEQLNLVSLREQLNTQATEARAMNERLEAAEWIRVGPKQED